MEYRKRVDLPTGSDYWFVEMGPIPGKPKWHQEMYRFQSYAFPTEKAANRFAGYHQKKDPERMVWVRQGE